MVTWPTSIEIVLAGRKDHGNSKTLPQKTFEKRGHKELADLSSAASQSSLAYCGWALTSESDWIEIEILSTGQILYDRLRLAMSHLAVSHPERFHCGRLIKASPEPQWFELQHDFESWGCDTAVRQTSNFGLQMEINLPYCLKANQEKNREESIGNVMSDDWWGEGETVWVLPPPAKRQQLAEDKRCNGVKEVRSLPSWQECGHYHATAMGIKLSYFCHVQLPAGDKRCLAEPANLPASLGTCPRYVNWRMRLPSALLPHTDARKKKCSWDKWQNLISRHNLLYCRDSACDEALSTHLKNTDTGKASSFVFCCS